MDWGDGCDCDGDWGLGWIFPAIIVGKILGEVFEKQRPFGGVQPWPQPAPQARPAPQPQSQPRPAAKPVGATLRCGHCGGAVTSQYTFCPHCGRRLEAPACSYCGQTLDPKVNYCTHCGAPAVRTSK